MPAQQSQFSVLTFNLLAPCYKRLFSPSGQELRDRERDHSHLWSARLDAILSLLDSITPAPDIIALQEVWFHPPFLSRLQEALSERYHVFTTKRPGRKDDGLATLIRKNHALLSHPTLHQSFQLSNTDRVALAVRVCLTPSSPAQTQSTLLVLNTHLTFPHSKNLRRVRDTQVRALTSFVSGFVSSSPGSVSTLVLGDFNSDMESTVCTRMTDAHFLNCYTALNGPGAQPTTHYNHRRQQVFVDHIFLRNDSGPARISSRHRNTTLHDSSPPRHKSAPLCSRSCSPSNIGLTNLFDIQPHMSTSADSIGGHISRIRPIASAVYPTELPIEQWPAAFHVSDHRPVGISFGLESVLT